MAGEGLGEPMSWEVEVRDLRQLLEAVGEYLLSLSGTILFALGVFLLSRLVRRRFHRLAERRGMHRSVPALFDNVVQVVVYIIIGFLVLAALGVNTRSLATFAGLVTAALALSVQDVLKNIFSGFYLLAERPFSVGDRIRVGAEEGTIERIDLRVTRIRNDRRELVIVPNSIFFSQISVARSSLRARSLTVQLRGAQDGRADAEARIRETVAGAAAGDGAPAIRLLQVGPGGWDFEVTVGETEPDAQGRVIAALNAAFPDATIAIVAA